MDEPFGNPAERELHAAPNRREWLRMVATVCEGMLAAEGADGHEPTSRELRDGVAALLARIKTELAAHDNGQRVEPA